MNFETELVEHLSQPLGPKRGRPKGSKDKPRPPDAPRRGRPPKNINTSVSEGISAVKSHSKSYLHQILIRH
jgi:hypothetical protein